MSVLTQTLIEGNGSAELGHLEQQFYLYSLHLACALNNAHLRVSIVGGKLQSKQ